MTSDSKKKDNHDDVVPWNEPSMADNRGVGAGRGASSLERQVEEGQLIKPARDGRIERYKGVKVQMNLRVPPEVKLALEKMAKRHKSNSSAMVEACVRQYEAAEARRKNPTA